MKWEQKTEIVETGGFLSRGKVDVDELNDVLMTHGADGFELVAAVPVSDGAVGTRRIALFFKRPLAGNPPS